MVALGYFMYINTQETFRYDEQYFTPNYQEKYNSPGAVARELEGALKVGNQQLLKELRGIHRDPGVLEPKPTLVLSILIDVDDAGYFHYLFFDFDTYRRSIYYIIDVRERWVLVPEDLYFYWQTGRWLDFYIPLALTWWFILIIAWGGLLLFQQAKKIRQIDFNRY
jgi:hypothetical protein